MFAVDHLFVSSRAQSIGNPKYTEHAHSDKRQWIAKGIQIIPGQCQGDALTTIQNAILDASYLAGAGLSGASSFTSPPFSCFFQPDQEVANSVAGFLVRVQQSQLSNGQLIGATCEDVYNRCGPLRSKANGDSGIAYLAQDKNGRYAPIIVVCPAGLLLPRNLVLCTADPGAQSLGGSILHEMTHICRYRAPTWIFQMLQLTQREASIQH